MIKLKKILCAALCLVMLFAAGCKANDTSGVVEPIGRLALITTALELETDYNYADVWEGIVDCATTNSIDYGYYRPSEMTEADIEEQFDCAAKEGATVIVCMGDVFGSTIAKMQTKYPEVKFIAIDVSPSSIGELKTNTHCVMFRQEQGGYLAGYGAVKDGFTKLAYMGDHESESYFGYACGFVQGANDAAVEAKKKIEIKLGYISDFESKDAAAEACKKWYEEGTEILMLCADDEFAQKCAEHAVANVSYLIGTNNDQSYLGANFDYNPFMTSAMKGLREGVDATLEKVLAGAWAESLGGKIEYFGLENGNYIYMPEYAELWLFKDFSLENYGKLKDSIAAGTIAVSTNALPDYNAEFVTVDFSVHEK